MLLRRLLASLLMGAMIAAAVGTLSRSARADGMIVVSNPPVTTVRGHFSFAPLEVTYHKVAVTIDDQVATTAVDQEFYNPNAQILEGDYIFPVPAGAQINKFSMDINGTPVEAELLPADKARAIYNEIVRKVKDPALLEYAGRDMYRVHIFPIEANGKKHITLKYTELLKQDNGLLDYHYTLNTEKFSSKPLNNVSMKVTVNSSEPITTLYSPTHDLDKAMHGDKSATVGFEGKNIRPDQDFHLFIGRENSAVGISVLSYRPDPAKEGYYVLLASPTVSKDVKAMPKDVVFVMDTSGSMAGDKIEQARKALKYCIDTINPQDRFDVLRFSTEAEPLFNGLKDANDENKKKALDFAANLRAAGGTAIDDALLKALAERPGNDPNRVFMVVFMTDGQPTIGEQNPDAILKHEQAAANGAQTRIFTFGVGTDVNTKLLDLMAEQTRGYSQYVLPGENLELSMSNFWGKAQDPVIAGLKLDTGGVMVSKVYPKEMPDLFKGDQLVAFGSYDKPGKSVVSLTGIVNGKERKFTQEVTFEEKTDTSKEWIAKLWATRRVGYLLDEIRLHGENKELKDEVVELARKWGVVTPYTAMLIIEDERSRGVPLAQRSLREMEFDGRASANAAGVTDSLRRQEQSGSSLAVTNSVNTNAFKATENLQQGQALAAQDSAHMQFDGVGQALAKGPDAPAFNSAGTIVLNGGGFGGGRGGSGGGGGGGAGGVGGAGGGGARGVGSRARSGGIVGGAQADVAGGIAYGAFGPSAITAAPAATMPSVQQLNLGTQNASGWQTQQSNKEAQGYRMINNYAQQARTINNRSFFLNGNQWTDANVQNLKDAKHVKVVFGSADYFDLLAKHPDAAPFLSLGNNLTIELSGTVYDIVEE